MGTSVHGAPPRKKAFCQSAVSDRADETRREASRAYPEEEGGAQARWNIGEQREAVARARGSAWIYVSRGRCRWLLSGCESRTDPESGER